MTPRPAVSPDKPIEYDGENLAKPAILLVDDEVDLLRIFSRALEPYFDVTTASGSREAEFILHKQPFDAIVADHMMPDGNGMGLLVRAREEYPEMVRILMTGYMKPEMLLRSVNEAALYRYLLKPVPLKELVTVLQSATQPAKTA